MNAANQTTVTQFLLLGFQYHQILNPYLSFLFLVAFILTIFGNLLIIMLVAKSEALRSPMYFFLSHLSFSDILLSTTITPKMLDIVRSGGGFISVTDCITQLFFYSGTTTAECLLLTVMSYDRYLAICKPLHYNSIMNLTLQLCLATWPWVIGFLVALLLIVFVCHFKFCGPYIMDHYLCDLAPILELTCSDHSVLDIVDFILTIPFIIFPFFFITFTYVSIFLNILKISSSSGRKKAFSTCSSHLIVVSLYYGTLMNVYMIPSKIYSYNIKKLVSPLYTMGTPLLNPIIYSLRNQEIKIALNKCISFYIQKAKFGHLTHR
ncbi:PREDICTED: olfactory receptor 6B1-like [Nanorana parkeri]|uniref:olfactory receptor 6B1-like n=1 Tax=Nanorana parkeri TaxID=125878 RepID=UPI00085494B7|nr:PREDICTED: olfactory receptor 6B1-like [Nanorana parkeri]